MGALGADGVNLGTVLCVTQESNWPSPFKESMVKSDERDTCLVNRPFKSTSRFFKNGLAKEVLAVEKSKGDTIKYSDVAHLTTGTRRKQAWANGDADYCMLSAGQGIGLIYETLPVRARIDRMMQEAEEIMFQRIQSMLVPSTQAVSKL